MKPSRHKLVRQLFALGLIAFVLVGWLAPLVVSEHGSSVQRAGYAEAGNRHIVHIDKQVMLFDRPLLVIERAAVSLAPTQQRALSDNEIATTLRDGTAELLVEDAKFMIDGTGLHPARVAAIDDAIKPILQSLQNLSFATVTIRDAKLMAQPAAGGGASLFGVLDCSIAKASGDQLRIKGTLQRHAFTVPFDISLNTKTAKSANGRLPISVTIASDLLTASLSGEFLRDDAFGLQASYAKVSAPNAKDVIHWMSGSSISGQGLEKFSATGRLEWTDETLAFQDAKFNIDGNDATGTLSISAAGQRPKLDGTLAFETLELAPYQRPAPASLAGFTQNALDWSRWLVGGTSSAIIRDLDADLRLSAASVTSGGHGLGRGAASVTVKDGKLLADFAEIELDQETQGNARIAIDISGSTPRFELHGMLESPDLANVTKLVTDRHILTGSGRVSADVTAKGSTESEIHTSLSGTATVSMPDGGEAAIDLGSVMTGAAAANNLAWDQIAKGKTAFDTLQAKLEASNGVVKASSVKAETTARTLTLDGAIDLPAKSVDLSMTMAPKDAKGTAAVTDRIRIHGPLPAPQLKLETPSRAALSLSKP